MNKVLRPYQEEAVNTINNSMYVDGNTTNLLSLPCGAGKTFTGGSIGEHFIKLNHANVVIWLVHRIELLKSAKKEFESRGFKPYIVDSSDAMNKPEFQLANVIIVMIRSFLASSMPFPKNSNSKNLLLIQDEAHHEHANSWKTVRENLNPGYILDLTATPKEAALDQYGANVTISFEELVKQGFLSMPIYQRVKTNLDIIGIKVGAGDFTTTSLKKLNVSARRKLIVKQWLDNSDKYDKTIIFVSSVAEAIDLSYLFNKKTKYEVYHILGNTPWKQREQRFKDFDRNTKPCVMIARDIFIEGLDVPSVKTIFMCRPTLSHIVYTQMIGRGSRVTPTKTSFHIVDFVDNIKRYEMRSVELLANVIGEHLPEELEMELSSRETSKQLKKLKLRYNSHELNIIIGHVKWNNKFKKYGKCILLEEDLEILYVVFKRAAEAVAKGKKFTSLDVNNIYAQIGTITSIGFKDFKSMLWSILSKAQGGEAAFNIYFFNNYKPKTDLFRTYEEITVETKKELDIFNQSVTIDSIKHPIINMLNHAFGFDRCSLNEYDMRFDKIENKILYITLNQKCFRKIRSKNIDVACIGNTGQLKKALTLSLREVLNDNKAEVTISVNRP